MLFFFILYFFYKLKQLVNQFDTKTMFKNIKTKKVLNNFKDFIYIIKKYNFIVFLNKNKLYKNQEYHIPFFRLVILHNQSF